MVKESAISRKKNLQIAMNDAFRVEIMNGGDDLPEFLSCFAFRHPSMGDEMVCNRQTSTESAMFAIQHQITENLAAAGELRHEI